MIDGEKHDASLLMDELEKEPMALGTGTFVIHQEFHFKVNNPTKSSNKQYDLV